jgi:hypothetical protein
MPEQAWIIFGVLAWLGGYIHTRFILDLKKLQIPLLIYFICGFPSGLNSREVTFEGFRLQFLGLLLVLIPNLKYYVKISDVYLLLGSLAFSTIISFLLMQMQD